MKVKHYLSKAERKELENILSFWSSEHFKAVNINDEYSAHIACENYYMYIDYIKWCGFRIKYSRQCKYKIIK